MSLQNVFDGCRKRLSKPGSPTLHSKGDGLTEELSPVSKEFYEFAGTLLPDFVITKSTPWCGRGKEGLVSRFLWARLVYKEHKKNFIKPSKPNKSEFNFSISLLLTRSETNESLMALTAGFVLEERHYKAPFETPRSFYEKNAFGDPDSYKAFNSVLEEAPPDFDFVIRQRNPGDDNEILTPSISLEKAREELSATNTHGKKNKLPLFRITKTIEEVPGKDDNYYRNALVPIFQKLVPLYWKAYDKLIELRTGQKPVQAEGPAVEKDPSPAVEKDPSFPLNLILQGPPGTGKTYRSIALASALAQGNYSMARYIVSGKDINDDDYNGLQSHYKKDLLYFDTNGEPSKGHIAFTTFHQSYSYEEFVEGIFPKVDEKGSLTYSIKDGIFKSIARLALEHPHENYVLLIDEINRGNVSKILGDLISLLEWDKRLGGEHELKAVLPYSRTLWGVPANLYLIGTMNTADRSIERLDTALMRRFAFFEILPNPALLSDRILEKDGASLSLQELLEAMNARIKRYLGPERAIGHSYFMRLGKEVSLEDLSDIFRNRILPTLLESALGDYRKVRKILGEEGAKDGIVCTLGEEDSYEGPAGYVFDYEALSSFKTYRRIAQESSPEDEEG